MKVLIFVLDHQVLVLVFNILVLVLVSVLKKKSCSFSRLLSVILDGSDKAQCGVL